MASTFIIVRCYLNIRTSFRKVESSLDKMTSSMSKYTEAIKKNQRILTQECAYITMTVTSYTQRMIEETWLMKWVGGGGGGGGWATEEIPVDRMVKCKQKSGRRANTRDSKLDLAQLNNCHVELFTSLPHKFELRQFPAEGSPMSYTKHEEEGKRKAATNQKASLPMYSQ